MALSLSRTASDATSLLGAVAASLAQLSHPSLPAEQVHDSSHLNRIKLHAWNQMKSNLPQGPLKLTRLIDDIEKAFPDETHLEDKVDSLYHQLGEKLAPEFDAFFAPDESRIISQAHLITLQERLQSQYENKALETIWRKALAPRFHLEDDSSLQSHDAIRTWLNDPIHAAQIQEIGGLVLSRLKLKALPPEISHFTALRSLTLSYNQLWFLPEQIGNCTALQMINLSNNQLTALPEQIGNCAALQVINLSNNQLTALPEQIGSLSALQLLFLQNNQLTVLPEQIGSLSALQSLFLQNNQLTVLPEQIGSLSALQLLSLQNNQLTSLPEQIGSLNALQLILINENPLMFISNNKLKKGTDLETLMKYYKAFVKYPTQSSLGDLFKLIATNKDTASIQNTFDELDSTMQQRISELAGVPLIHGASSSSSSSTSSISMIIDMRLFEDIPSLGRALREAALEKFEGLSNDMKKRVYRQIYELAGKPKTEDGNWGRHHLFNNMLRFVDALEIATGSSETISE